MFVLCTESGGGDDLPMFDPADKRFLYFYHPDYLGNVEYITNMDGLPYQYFSYTPWGEAFKDDIVNNNSWDSPYRFIGKELDEETGLYFYGARYYNPSVSVWLSVDPLAEKYPNLSSYCFTANNPIMLVDPDGRHIDIAVEAGAGPNNSDVMTITVTGKLINFSGKDIDMDDALGEIKSYVEDTYKGTASDGTQINVVFDFEVAEDMNDVSGTDHLIVLSHGKNSDVAGAANQFGGRVANVDADYFSGWYDTNFGETGERTATHELGHLFNLRHVKGRNIMSQGGSSKGNSMTQSQVDHLRNLQYNSSQINRGSSIGVGGLPNMGAASVYFELRSTYGRQKKYVPPTSF